MFTLRLMACMGAAGLVSEVLPLQRSYWVPLTVAIVWSGWPDSNRRPPRPKIVMSLEPGC